MTHILPNSSESVTVSDSAIALLSELRARFPILNECKPLKLGIRQDIRTVLDGVISGVRIAKALLVHIATPDYQAALASGGPRYALDGSPCGKVSPKEQRHAQAVIEGRAAMPTTKARKKPKPPPQAKAQPSPAVEAITPPPADPVPAAGAPIPPSARPLLRLKRKDASAPTITATTITRKERKP